MTSLVIVELLGALALGHAPALFARYAVKRVPLPLASLVILGVTSCVLLVLAAAASHEALGVPRLKVTISLVGVSALLSIATMVRGKRERLILALQEMIVDPATTADRRALALDRLEKLSGPIRRTSDMGGETGSKIITRDRQPDGQAILRNANRGTERSRLRAYGRRAAFAAGAVLALNLLLIVSGYRVLVHQRIVESGQEYVTDEWIFGSEARALIVCQYWTGRSVKPTALHYGPGGRETDECPAFFAPAGPAT